MQYLWTLLFTLLLSPIFAQSMLDAAFSWDATSVFFIKGEQAIHYNDQQKIILKTQLIPEAFPGINWTTIDAAVNVSDELVYFFKGNEFIIFNKKKQWIETTEPRPISSSIWAKSLFSQVSAGLNWSNGKAFVFHNNQYARLNKQTQQIDEHYPKTINNTTWPGIPFSTIDAAFLRGKKAFLFSQDAFVQFDIESDKVDASFPKKIHQNWSQLATALQNTSHLDKFNYQRFIKKETNKEQTIYNVDQAGVDLLFGKKAAKKVTYTDFNGNKHQLYPWYGKHIVYLTKEKPDNLKALYLMVAFTDMGWEQFGTLTGKLPKASKKYLLNGRSTFAILPKASCGSGCGQVGSNGVEISDNIWSFYKLAKQLEANQPITIGFLPFYEMGRNFAVFNNILKIDDKKQQFNSGQLMAETTKILNYTYAAQQAGIPISSSGTVEHHSKKALVHLQEYLADKTKNSSNTLLQQQDHKGGKSYNLMRSLMFFVIQNYGGYDCVQRMWAAAVLLEKPTTPQDVLDNYFLLACFGAKTDLTKLFEHNFKYTISDKMKQVTEEFAKANFQVQ